jgi:uncharacterized RDD family membrane protein YckC
LSSPVDKSKRFVYASFWDRLGAFLLDGFLILSPIVLVIGVLFGYDALKAKDPNRTLQLIEMVLVGIVFVYFWRTKGATPGKMVLKLFVVKEGSFETITTTQAVVRYLAWLVCWFTFGLGFLVVFFDKRKRSLSDIVSKTVVVRKIDNTEEAIQATP